METHTRLSWSDVIVLVFYFVVIFCVGIVVIVRQRKGNVKHYFLAGRTMPWFAVGGSLFSSNLGTEMVIALSGAGAAAGISMVMYEWLPIFIILAFSWFLLPVYISAQVYTLPEYMEKRYGGSRLRLYLSCVGIIIIIITKMASVMFTGALFIQVVLQWDMHVAIVVLLLVSMIFTMIGGLKTVMVIGALQTVMFLSGGVVIMILSFIKINGYHNLQPQYAMAIPGVRNNNTTCGLPREDAFHVFQNAVDGDQPWPGLLLQASLGGIYNWCCNQILVQRSLAAKSLSHAKGGAIMLATIKLFPLFLIIFPDQVACSDPDICRSVCDNPAGCSNIAYPMLIMELLPLGLRGLLLAVMMSGIMITLASVTNSTSTVFTMDIWRKFRPAAKQRELLIVGRISVVIICSVAILWIPFVKAFQNGRLFSYVLSVGGYLGSPLGVLFCLSVLWTGATEKGAFWGIVSAHLLGLVRLIPELMHPAPSCGDKEDNRIFISRLHYTYFIQIQMVFTLLVSWAISLGTKRRSEEQLRGMTWWTKVSPSDDITETDDKPVDPYLNRTNSSQIENKHQFPALLKADTTTESVPKPNIPCEKLFHFVCGTTDEVHESAQYDLTTTKDFLRENKSVSMMLNCSAIVLMVIVSFIIGFFK